MLIKNLPEEIQKIVFKRQKEQGNSHEVCLDIQADAKRGNFNWGETVEGKDIWDDINYGMFDSFYEFHKNLSGQNNNYLKLLNPNKQTYD
jgi:hypothetical protein